MYYPAIITFIKITNLFIITTMKLINLLIILALFVSVNSFGQITVKSKVKEATIFSNQAQVLREQSVKLSKGLNKVKFIGLERSVQNNTIQVSGTGGITIVSTNTRVENTQKKDQPLAIRKVMDSIAVLNRKESLLRNEVKNLGHEKNAAACLESQFNGARSGCKWFKGNF